MLEDVRFDERVFNLVGTCNLMRISEVSVMEVRLDRIVRRERSREGPQPEREMEWEVRNSKKEEMRKRKTPIRAICADIASGCRQE